MQQIVRVVLKRGLFKITRVSTCHYKCSAFYNVIQTLVILKNPLFSTTRTICCIYTLLPPDDGQLASPKHVEIQ
jgi:hypothetical protein